MNESHPVIRFKQIPIVKGPLEHLEENRLALLQDVTKKTLSDLTQLVESQAQTEGPNSFFWDNLLSSALYSERNRLRREKSTFFTRQRLTDDRRLWNQVQAGLVKPAAEKDRKVLLESILSHYSEEIGGHFEPRVYQMATRAVPWGFSWLLNAASVRRFLPWGMTESLASRLTILGEIPHLQQLAKKGTILLVPTHQSNIDSVLIGYVIYMMSLPPFAYGAGLNLFSNPLLSYFLSRLGSYTVDRKKSNDIYKLTLKNYSTRILREGIHSIFFPGGGRSRSGAIETKLKLGLLGTALEAELENRILGKPNPRVFVVPMITSYHFVLEARSLIDDYLAEAGKHKFIMMDDESWQLGQVVRFFWKLFSSQSGITVRIGRPLDVFGNPVDEDGNSIGPGGRIIQPEKWLTTCGKLQPNLERDQEYVRELGAQIADRYQKDNTVLSSHLVAFVLFQILKQKYPHYDLYKLLRLSAPQRTVSVAEFMTHAEVLHTRFIKMEKQGQLHLSDTLQTSSTSRWVGDGVKHLGLLHAASAVKMQEDLVWTEDMNLLYYYQNRLSGYKDSSR